MKKYSKNINPSIIMKNNKKIDYSIDIYCPIDIYGVIVDPFDPPYEGENSTIFIFMPTYNKAAHAAIIIRYMLNQTYTNWILMVMDNGSNKYYYSLLEDCVNKINDKRIILKRSNKHMKFSAIHNLGITEFLKSKCNYFTWIKNKNIIYNNFLETLVKSCKGFCYTSFDISDISDHTKKIKSIQKEYIDKNDLMNNFSGMASFAWSRKTILTVGYYNENLNNGKGFEDYEYILRTFMSGCNIKFVDITTIKYISRTNAMNRMDPTIIKEMTTIINKNFENCTLLKTFLYYSQTPYTEPIQRQHHIMKFYDNSYRKYFICSENLYAYDDLYKLDVVPYNDNTIRNVITSFNNVVIYFTDPKFLPEINKLKAKINGTCIVLYDLVNAPVDEYAAIKQELPSVIHSVDKIMYSHPKMTDFLNLNDPNAICAKKYQYISNGCDYTHFSKAKNKIYPRPTDIPTTNKPILGYYGAFSDCLDIDAIKYYANSGIYHLLMIGGQKNITNRNLRFEHTNITWLDYKSYNDIPIYLSWFDICFIPFKKCELTQYMNPFKYWEYISTNKQIISTNFNTDSFDTGIIKMTDVAEQISEFIDNNRDTYDSYDDFIKYVISLNKNVFVTLPTIPWYCPLYQRPQHIASAFAKIGYISIYITNYFSDKMSKPIEKLTDNLWLVRYDDAILNIEDAYYSFYSTSFGSNYEKFYTQINKNGGYFIYEYIDHINEQICGNKEICDLLVKCKEYAIAGFADLIVPSADILRDEVKHLNHVLVKNGVSVDHYLSKQSEVIELDAPFINFRKKYGCICGYFGAIAPWLDYDILVAIAKYRPDVGFVYIGPDYQDSVKLLPTFDNVIYMGAMNYKLLPYYAHKFDICFIPFSEGDIAKATSPLKLYEYFSLQKPVIASNYMSECIQYKEVLNYSSCEEFSNAIDRAKELMNDEIYKSTLLTLAKENDWVERVKVYADKLEHLNHKINDVELYHNLINYNTYPNNNDCYEFTDKWGVNVCALTFSGNHKYNYDLSTYDFSNHIVAISVFALYDGDLILGIDDKKYTITLHNHIQHYTFALNDSPKSLSLMCTDNVVYISRLFIVYDTESSE